MAAAVDEKSMVPTVLVGIGGTGAEVLSRVRRLVEETYGDLKNFPILGFLLIDTDKDYKITNPEAAGTPFKDYEKHWARVQSKEAQDLIERMENYPWISQWFPTELERNLTSLEAGAGQIRACGRLAFFVNYKEIEKKFLDTVRRTKGHENSMLDRYSIKVNTSGLNVFVTGSLSGGTGSGMLIDVGYAIRNWARNEGSVSTTSIVPMPTAFAGISVGDRVLANGYAAMMELSYFSDYRTEYRAAFSGGTANEIVSKKSPFDFTYLVGTKNGESDFKLDQIREMIAQNIFLDLTSDFAPHKRSIRDNIKGSWAQQDPGGRSYPRNFMSLGLSAIEIPVAQIRASLSNRLGRDLASWWLNESAQLPPQMLDLVRSDQLKRMRLTEPELLADITAAENRPYLAVVSEWVNSLRNEIATQDLLKCTQQGANVLGSEQGAILYFVDRYLKPKVDDYLADHFRELSPDERVHGDFLKRIYDNRNQLIQRARKSLEDEFYSILEDRTKGPKFADSFIVTVRQIFNDATERFRREQDKVWAVNETNRKQQYEASLQDIVHFKDKFGLTKQAKMEEYCEAALQGLEGSLIATLQRKAREAGLEVLQRLQEHLTLLEARLNRWQQRVSRMRDFFQDRADRQAESADALTINGIKLFDRQELNGLYSDLIEQLAGATEGSKTRYEIGLNATCSTLSTDILKDASPLWKIDRQADEIMRLFDFTEVPEVQEEDIREIVFERSRTVVVNAPQGSRVKKELAACDRLFRQYQDDSELLNNLRIAYQKSKPLILLSRSVMQGGDAGFTESTNQNVAVLGGSKTADPAAMKLLPKLKEFLREDDIKPLGDPERHRIVFVQETGGFSLRCIDGMRDLRSSYQDWRGENVVAKRKRLSGESGDPPIPVHIQKEPPFWDVFPEDPKVFSLVIKGRALGVLVQDTNKATGENTIRYTRKTAFGKEGVDVASSWEETVQVLEVRACRQDFEEIDRQVKAKLDEAKSEAQKNALFQQLLDYLSLRSRELAESGGEESPEHRREKKVLLDLARDHRLSAAIPEPEPEPVFVPAPVDDTATTVPPVPAPVSPSPAPTPDLAAKIKEIEGLGDLGVLTPEQVADAKAKLLGNDGKLQQLIGLRDSGVLTPEAFEVAKAKLLAL